MSCFSPTRGALSSSSSLCPFAFKVSALRCRSLPWPCDFIPSIPKLSECSKWYTWGLALFCHHSASRIFIMQLGCGLPPVVIYKDDHQPRGGEKRAGLQPPPCPQLQGCSSSSLGWKASRVVVLPSAWAGDPLLPPALGGEGCSPGL
jgi:hypothetical protein